MANSGRFRIISIGRETAKHKNLAPFVSRYSRHDAGRITGEYEVKQMLSKLKWRVEINRMT